MDIQDNRPAAEQNAVNALVRAGVDITKIAEIEYCSLSVDYTIRVLDYNHNKYQYNISRDFCSCREVPIYNYKSKQSTVPAKSKAYERAESFFNI